MKKNVWMGLLLLLMPISGLWAGLIGDINEGIEALMKFSKGMEVLGETIAPHHWNLSSSTTTAEGLYRPFSSSNFRYSEELSDPWTLGFWEAPNLLERIETYCSSSDNAVNNAIDKYGDTILHQFVSQTQPNGLFSFHEVNEAVVLDKLIELGADLEIRNKGNFTPLDLAIYLNKNIALMLIDKGASIETAWPSFLNSFDSRNEEMVETKNRIFDILFEHQIATGSCTCLDWNLKPIHLLSLAIRVYSDEKAWIEHYRQVENRNVEYLANKEQSFQSLQEVLEKIFTAPLEDILGEEMNRPPLAMAIASNDFKWAKKLIDAGANPATFVFFINYKNEEESTPLNALEYVKSEFPENIEMIELLTQ